MNSDKSQEEVKPCPFCGKECDSQKLNEEPVVWAVLCDDCNIGVSDGETEQEAVQKWNRRPRDAEVSALSARIAKLEGVLDKYGKHDRLCKVGMTRPESLCDCGLNDALSSVLENKEGK